MLSSGLDPAYPIQVMAPIRGEPEQRYRIINGQHRFHAAIRYFQTADPIPTQDSQVINCQVYSDITVAEEASIAANPVRDQKADENYVKFKRSVLYLDYCRVNPNPTVGNGVSYSDEQFGRIYAAEPGTGNWRRQCLRAVKFPCVHPERNPLKFLNLQLHNEEYSIIGMAHPMVNANEDPSQVYFADIRRDVVERPLENNALDVGGYLSYLHQQIMFSVKGYTNSGYAIIYTTLCNGLNKYLYPTQIIAMLENYREGLRRYEVDDDSDPAIYNKMFTGFASNINDVFEYLRTLIDNGTTVLPTLPAGWFYPENFEVRFLNTADLYQIFVLLMDPSDLTNVKSNLYKVKQNKALIIQQYFTGNVGSVIRLRWVALFRNPEAVVPPNATDVFGEIPNFQLDYTSGGLKGVKYTLKFFNSCVFSFCSRARANGVKYNLVLGDLPVSLIWKY